MKYTRFEDLPVWNDAIELKLLIDKFCESISRQIRAWADSLQNSDIKGQRHLTDQSRAQYDQSKRAQAFWEKIRAEHMARFDTNTSEQRAEKPGQAEPPG